MTKERVLFLAASPGGRDAVASSAEYEAIELVLRSTRRRDDFDLRPATAVTVDSIMDSLRSYRPTIIHFSGHGEPGGLIVNDERGNAHMIPPDGLQKMFASAARDAHLVVLNACYTKEQAEILRDTVGCVVGMEGTTDDGAALAFAVAFYRTLGHGCAVQAAYDDAVATLAAKKLTERAQPCKLERVAPGAVASPPESSTATSVASDADASGASGGRRRWRGPDAVAKVRQWLEAQLASSAKASETLRDELAEVDAHPDRFRAPSAALAPLLAEVLLTARPLDAVRALNRAHLSTSGDVRALLGRILGTAIGFVGEYEQLRRDVAAGESAVVLGIGTRTIAEVVSAGLDDLPIDLIPHPTDPVGRAALAVPPEMLVPLVPLESAKAITDHKVAVVEGLTVAVCGSSGPGRELFEQIRRDHDGQSDASRANRRAKVATVLQYLREMNERTRYLLFVDSELEEKKPGLDRDQLWALIGDAVTDPATGLAGLRLVRITKGVRESAEERSVVLHIAGVTNRP